MKIKMKYVAALIVLLAIAMGSYDLFMKNSFHYHADKYLQTGDPASYERLNSWLPTNEYKHKYFTAEDLKYNCQLSWATSAVATIKQDKIVIIKALQDCLDTYYKPEQKKSLQEALQQIANKSPEVDFLGEKIKADVDSLFQLANAKVNIAIRSGQLKDKF